MPKSTLMFCAACKREIQLEEGAQSCPSCGEAPLLEGRLRLDARTRQDGISACYDATWIDGAHERPARARSLSFRIRGEELDLSTDFEALRQARGAIVHPSLPHWLGLLVSASGNIGQLWVVHARVDGLALDSPDFVLPVGEAQVLAMVNEVGALLSLLHGAEPPFVHGALGPTSILRRAEDRRFVVLDLGANVTSVEGAAARSSKQVSDLVGFAPELVFAEPSPASDVWGLGLAAIVLLTGAGPSELRGTGGRLRWRDRAVVSPSFGDLLDAMVAPRPHKRIASGVALMRALTQLRPLSQAADAPTRRMSSEELQSELGIQKDEYESFDPASESGAHELASIAGEIGSGARTTSRRASSSSRRHRGSSRRHKRDPDAPVARPEDLSRELSEAKRTTILGDERERKRIELKQVLVILAVTVMAAGITWLLVLISRG